MPTDSGEHWRSFLAGDDPDLFRVRRLFARVPSCPCSTVCAATARGAGLHTMNLKSKTPDFAGRTDPVTAWVLGQNP